MSYCSNCGEEINQEYVFCPECGIKLTNDFCADTIDNLSEFDTNKYKTCKFCGARMPDDAFYCLSCGNSFPSQDDDFERIRSAVSDNMNPKKRKIDTSVGIWKNKWVSLVLCIFFGMFGLHRFYEEKRITGFIYLFTFGIMGFGWIFDIILIATKPNPYRVK